MPAGTQTLFAKHILRKLFLEDWPLKLTALVITFALWFTVTGLSSPTTKRLTLPLNLNIASNAQITNSPLQEVEIEISGDKRKVEQLNRSELVASVDLTESPTGDRVVLLTPETVFVPLPPGIKLNEVQPGRIAVNLELVAEKDVDVKIITEGTPAAGYEVYSSASLPPRIRIRGPLSAVEAINTIETSKIDLSDKTAEFTIKQVAVVSSDPRAAVLNTFVDVYFMIGERRIERTFTVPVSGSPGKTASFVLFGPKTVLTKAKSEDLRVEMAAGQDGEGVPNVILPRELENLVTVKKLRLVP